LSVQSAGQEENNRVSVRKIAVLPGDGIGPEVVSQAVKVLKALEQLLGTQTFELEYGLIGGAATEKHGRPLPEETLRLAKSSDAILMGAVGHPMYDRLPADQRPEKGLLAIRRELKLFANLRPVKADAPLLDASPLKRSVVENIDFVVVRELTGGLYFGEPRYKIREEAVDTLRYQRSEIERIARLAFHLANSRRKHVVSVDKANVLASSQLWREVVNEVASRHPEVTVEHMYVDNAAMQLVTRPSQFDVILTENMFGDILSDEASVLLGSLGMLSSASIGTKNHALYEPAHGSAPDIAGQNKANPIATIRSMRLMLELTFGMAREASLIEQAISHVLHQGYRTADIADSPSARLIGTEEMGALIADTMLRLAGRPPMSTAPQQQSPATGLAAAAPPMA
jgi:3-isopropylmalate dehydrogenase